MTGILAGDHDTILVAEGEEGMGGTLQLCDPATFLPSNEGVPVLPADLYATYPNYPRRDFNGTYIVPGTSPVGAVVAWPAVNTDAELALLDITPEGTPSIEFAPGTLEYDVAVEPTVTSITIAATAAVGSEVTPADTGAKNLVVGANPPFLIHVNKEDKDEVVYTLNVYRQSTSADLDALTVKVGGASKDLTPPFNKDTLSYTLKVDSGVTLVDIDAIPAAARAIVAGKGTALAIPADKKFAIKVTAEFGDAEKTYTITVTQGTTGGQGGETGVLASYAALSVHPNPTDGVVYIDNPDGAEVEVYNVLGVIVETRHAASLQGSSSATLDISHLPTGVYIIKVGDKVAKVVKR
jgi:hypothetical protein